MTRYLSQLEMDELGFRALGQNVQISLDARFFGRDFISIGSNVRIDSFAVITAGPGVVEIGDYCHVGVSVYISGAQGGVKIGTGVGIAPLAAIYSAVEDYTQGKLTNPTIPSGLRGTTIGQVTVEDHVAIGASSVVLAGVKLELGSSIGALSLVARDVRPFEVAHGNPIRRVGYREKSELLMLAKELLNK
jgi:acetyltransferase-like isoleucine patch superfamily enzyme